MITFSPHLDKAIGYDPQRDLVPIVNIAYADIGLVVANNVPANTLHEFVTLAKTSATPLAMGSAGTGNLTHAYIELFKDSAKVNILHVPYKGATPALTDVMGGQIAGMFIGLSSALPSAKAGKVKVLAVAGRRSTIAPAISMPSNPSLQKNFTTIVMDPRGIDRSSRVDKSLTAEVWATNFSSLLDQLGFDKARILGSSHWGSMAMAMALQHPEKVDTLMLFGAFSELNRFFTLNLNLRIRLAHKLGMDEDMRDFIALWTFGHEFLEHENADMFLATQLKAV